MAVDQAPYQGVGDQALAQQRVGEVDRVDQAGVRSQLPTDMLNLSLLNVNLAGRLGINRP